MTRIIIYMAVYKRHKTMKIVYEYYDYLLKQLNDFYKNIDIFFLLTFSEEEDVKLFTEGRYDNMRANIVMLEENKPLGRKFNKILSYLNTQLFLRAPYTYTVWIGCDDLLAGEYFHKLIKYIKDNTADKIIGLNSIYMYDLTSKNVVLLNNTAMFGAGLCISWEIYDKYLSLTGDLNIYNDLSNKGLDHKFLKQLINVVYNKKTSRFSKMKDTDHLHLIEGPRPLVVDIKDGDNIHSFDAFKKNPVVHGRELIMFKQTFSLPVKENLTKKEL